MVMMQSRVMPPRIDEETGGVDDDVVPHEEQVLAGALGDVAVDVKRDAFGVAVQHGFHLDQHRVGVVGRGLGGGGKRVGRRAVPRAHAHVHALLERIGAKVGAPLPHEHRGVDRTRQRVDAQLVVPAIHQRADVAGLGLVLANRLEDRVLPARLVERRVHAVDLRGIQQSDDMAVESEARRALGGAVAARAFEHARAVVNHVRRDVDLRVGPIHQRAVHPDLAGSETHDVLLATCHRDIASRGNYGIRANYRTSPNQHCLRA